jgi:bifunctional non-homologous end joining protein LigD
VRSKSSQNKSKPKLKTKSKSTTSFAISNPHKIFWPEDGYTKGDLAQFYTEVFPWLQPYVRDRILTMERCPDGMQGQCFYQKEMPKGMPPGTPSKRIVTKSGNRSSTNYVVGGSLETQIALVNFGCIPIHVTGSRAKTFPKPDWVCFDLDPMSGSFQDAARASVYVKKVLDELRLVSFAKTSGSRGLHIFVPVAIGPTADEALKFAEKLAAMVARAYPKELTVEHSIAARGDRVYVDPFRNGAVQTVVSPYSVRRKPHAPVSTPLEWSEVGRIKDPATFNIKNFAKRLKQSDPWADFFLQKQSLRAALSGLERLAR